MFGLLQGVGDSIGYVGEYPVDLWVVVVDVLDDLFGLGVDLVDSTGDDYKVWVVGCQAVGPTLDGIPLFVKVKAAGGTSAPNE